MILNKSIHIILISILLLVLLGCSKKVTEPETNPFGLLITYEGCKTFATAASTESSSHSSKEECIEYEYDGEGRLIIKHINSGFNCCPEKIEADIFVSGNMIYIEEREKEQGCFCQCCFDVDYEIHDLEPGDYSIEVKGPYIEDSDHELKFNVALYGSSSGTFCVNRTQYPWN